jgi:REP element-mobilizing transposase RayT
MHLVQRGINREPCFFAEEDYHCYLHWLQKSAADWHCALHAYVLMTNHVHLLITSTRQDGPAKLMQAIGRRYVQYINRTYKRSGSRWEWRYNLVRFCFAKELTTLDEASALKAGVELKAGTDIDRMFVIRLFDR